jgi:hypothetical protein
MLLLDALTVVGFCGIESPVNLSPAIPGAECLWVMSGHETEESLGL